MCNSCITEYFILIIISLKSYRKLYKYFIYILYLYTNIWLILFFNEDYLRQILNQIVIKCDILYNNYVTIISFINPCPL